MSETNDTQAQTQYFYGVGRRKRATARVKYFQDQENLEIVINGKKLPDYFNEFYQRVILNALSNMGIVSGKIALFIRGGGIKAQAESARLAIAKALVKADPGIKPVLKMYNYLTTDPRIVAPKKAGLRKNRKREQWSKR